MGNAFNRTLYELVGHVIGMEGRAISNLRRHDSDIGDGLTYWSPTINMQRDPRWGRNQEVPGEDPFLTKEYAKAFVNGVQGSSSTNDGTMRVGACCKHFVANSLENWNNYSRHNFDAHITDEDLHDYYFPPFEECSKHAAGVMCSYNAINGQPACASSLLLNDVLRTQWNFTGYIVTDCGALGDVVNGHHYAVNGEQASAMAKNASVDINCGDGTYFPNSLLRAYQERWVEESTIRQSFQRMATIQFRLGLFDVSKKRRSNPLHDIETIGAPHHRQLALEAALQGIVLLQNKNDLLPLDPNAKKKVAIIGPHLNATDALLSNYHGAACGCRCDGSIYNDFSCIETPFQAIARKVKFPQNIQSVDGCSVAGTDQDHIPFATELANESDVVILFVGIDQTQESEGKDRYVTTLPGLQPKLIQSILEVASERTIVVLIHGGSMSLGDETLKNAGAILTAGYGGQAGSRAIASVLFGEYDPTGKLSATWYPPSFVDDLPLTEMGLRVGVGRTHMFYTGKPEFAFGHGLSYNAWKLEWFEEEGNESLVPLTLRRGESIRVLVTIQMIGPKRPGNGTVTSGGQTVLLFWRPGSDSKIEEAQSETKRIQQKLIAFQETSNSMKVGESQRLEFVLTWNDFSLWNPSLGLSMAVHGKHELLIKTSDDTNVTRTIEVIPFSSTTNINNINDIHNEVRPVAVKDTLMDCFVKAIKWLALNYKT
jgi:beta-glucosidase-like glycosyl hydrolase